MRVCAEKGIHDEESDSVTATLKASLWCGTGIGGVSASYSIQSIEILLLPLSRLSYSCGCDQLRTGPPI